jgi:hypothetical protein
VPGTWPVVRVRDPAVAPLEQELYGSGTVRVTCTRPYTGLRVDSCAKMRLRDPAVRASSTRSNPYRERVYPEILMNGYGSTGRSPIQGSRSSSASRIRPKPRATNYGHSVTGSRGRAVRTLAWNHILLLILCSLAPFRLQVREIVSLKLANHCHQNRCVSNVFFWPSRDNQSNIKCRCYRPVMKTCSVWHVHT